MAIVTVWQLLCASIQFDSHLGAPGAEIQMLHDAMEQALDLSQRRWVLVLGLPLSRPGATNETLNHTKSQFLHL